MSNVLHCFLEAFPGEIWYNLNGLLGGGKQNNNHLDPIDTEAGTELDNLTEVTVLAELNLAPAYFPFSLLTNGRQFIKLI